MSVSPVQTCAPWRPVGLTPRAEQGPGARLHPFSHGARAYDAIIARGAKQITAT